MGMNIGERRGGATITAKIPLQLLERLDGTAEIRSVTRSAMIRELVEALADGRVILPVSEGFGHSIAEISTSKVGRAVEKYAQLDVAAALNRKASDSDHGSVAPVVDPLSMDYDKVARVAARLIAEGRA